MCCATGGTRNRVQLRGWVFKTFPDPLALFLWIFLLVCFCDFPCFLWACPFSFQGFWRFQAPLFPKGLPCFWPKKSQERGIGIWYVPRSPGKTNLLAEYPGKIAGISRKLGGGPESLRTRRTTPHQKSEDYTRLQFSESISPNDTYIGKKHPSRDVIFSGQNLARKCQTLSLHMTSLSL